MSERRLPTQARLLELFLVTKDGQLQWRAKHNPKVKLGVPAGTRVKGYWEVRIKGVRYFAHHIVWKMHTGRAPRRIDHADGNTENNRPKNLRPCTQSENMQNARRQRSNTSGLLGVSWCTRRQCWVAQIKLDQKVRYLGSRDDKHEAHQLYLDAKAKLHTFHPEVTR